MGEKADTGTKLDERRLDLSVPQVAGSALAAVAAAVLASRLGVYGTIVGAGVVSVVATCGGTVFQHLFRRTGEQLRDVTVQTLPRARRGGARPAHEDRPGHEERREGEFGAATVHGTRLRGWKRSSLGAAVVFAVAMGGITTYELASGAELGGGGGGTTVGSVVTGGGGKAARPEEDSGPGRPASPTPGTGGEGGTPASPDPGGGTGAPTPGTSRPTSPSSSPTPSAGTGSGGGTSTGGTGSGGGASPGGTPSPAPSSPSAPEGGGSPAPDPATPGTGPGAAPDAVPSP